MTAGRATVCGTPLPAGGRAYVLARAWSGGWWCATWSVSVRGTTLEAITGVLGREWTGAVHAYACSAAGDAVVVLAEPIARPAGGMASVRLVEVADAAGAATVRVAVTAALAAGRHRVGDIRRAWSEAWRQARTEARQANCLDVRVGHAAGSTALRSAAVAAIAAREASDLLAMPGEAVLWRAAYDRDDGGPRHWSPRREAAIAYGELAYGAPEDGGYGYVLLSRRRRGLVPIRTRFARAAWWPSIDAGEVVAVTVEPRIRHHAEMGTPMERTQPSPNGA